jgi:hypothetical protein
VIVPSSDKGLKLTFLKPTVPRYLDLMRDFIVDTGASGFGIGAVLAQLQLDKGEKKE